MKNRGGEKKSAFRFKRLSNFIIHSKLGISCMFSLWLPFLILVVHHPVFLLPSAFSFIFKSLPFSPKGHHLPFIISILQKSFPQTTTDNHHSCLILPIVFLVSSLFIALLSLSVLPLILCLSRSEPFIIGPA